MKSGRHGADTATADDARQAITWEVVMAWALLAVAVGWCGVAVVALSIVRAGALADQAMEDHG